MPDAVSRGDRPARRIAIATNGRFHVLDLARELAALGHEVRFYSMLRDGRVESFGLDRRNARSLFATVAPFAAWDKFAPAVAPGLRQRAETTVLNWSVTRQLEPCDVFIGMSGLILEAAEAARDRFGALVYLERGSEHIEVQRDLLRAAGAPEPSALSQARELAGYRIADRIVIPTRHVARSFAGDANARGKLFINPYGVDLAAFPRRTASHAGPPTIAFVGGWSVAKGADLAMEAMDRLPEAHLLHAGSVLDQPFPNDPRFKSLGHVQQNLLWQVYHRADVHLLPSRAEGMGLVRLQALACGLPTVATVETGAADLRHSPGLSARIDEVPQNDAGALTEALRQRLADRATLAPITDEDRNLLSWEGYARRYAAQIDADLAARNSGQSLGRLA